METGALIASGYPLQAEQSACSLGALMVLCTAQSKGARAKKENMFQLLQGGSGCPSVSLQASQGGSRSPCLPPIPPQLYAGAK